MAVYIDRDKLEDFAMDQVGGVVTMEQIHNFPAAVVTEPDANLKEVLFRTAHSIHAQQKDAPTPEAKRIWGDRLNGIWFAFEALGIEAEYRTWVRTTYHAGA